MNGDGCYEREWDWCSAGDRLRWRKFFPQWNPQNGWSLSYSIIGEGIQITFQSTVAQDGVSFIIDVPTTVTALWIPNDAAILTGYAIRQANWNGGNNEADRREFYSQVFPIKPNLQAPRADQPFLTDVQKALAALWTLYLNKANDDLLIAHVGDSSFRFETKKELLEQIGILTALRRTEVAIERARNGKPSRSRISPRMAITPQGPFFGSQWPFGGWTGA